MEHLTDAFFYYTTKGAFVKAIEHGCIAPIIENMCKSAKTAGVSCEGPEIKSWKANMDALSELLTKSKISDDAIIAFEYRVPVGGRIDCVLFGHSKDGSSNMIHIELKQWSNKNVSEHFSGYTFCTDIILDGGKQTKYTSHPSAQAQEYQNHLLNYVHAFKDENINLYGFAFCYNYLSKGKNPILCDDKYAHVTRYCPLYCKDQIEEFAQKLNKLIGSGKGQDIMDKIVNSNIGITKRLQDAAKNMFDGKCDNEEFALIGTQLDAYNAILGSILKTDKDREKTVVVVKGGPGTGKSVIAMRLIAGLAKSGKFKNVFYATRSTSLINGYTKILKNVSYAEGKDNNATDLLKKNVKIKPHFSDDCKGESWIDALIVDEAHRIEKSSNDQNDKDKRNQTHLSQIMNMLFSSRVSVFFIDDFQSVKGTEIGNSENIKYAALHYYENIKKENEVYVDGTPKARGKGFKAGYPSLPERIANTQKKLEAAISIGDEEKIKDLKKKISSLEGELKYGLEWVKDATPSNVKINYIPFVLEDQFRCNGSNNYIDWIERVLYKTERTKDVKLDLSKYEFKVFDSPSDMYKEVRRKDDFAKFADDLLAKGYSYDDVLNAAKNKEFKQRARLLAGWCWPWKQKKREPDGDLLHEIIIPEDGSVFSIPWETLSGGLKPTGKYKNMYALNADMWLNDINGINQTGCIHSAQGWEVDYVGVIIAGDIKYDSEHDCLCCNDDVKNEDKKVPKKGVERDRITKNIYRVLMTRGKKGCFVYACDPQVREYIKRLLYIKY